MNTLILASAHSGAGNNNMFMIISIIAIGAIMYFGMIRPQKKQQQQRMQMMDQLKKGDRVVLIDGLHGKIDSINENDQTVVVDADGIYLTFSRMAIRQILPEKTTKTNNEKAATKEATTKESETKPEEAKSEAEEPSDTTDENNEE